MAANEPEDKPESARKPLTELDIRVQFDAIRICIKEAGHWDDTWESELDDLKEVALKGIALPELQHSKPMAWLIHLHEPVDVYFNKDDAEMEFARRNKRYPEKERKLFPLYAHPAAPVSASGAISKELDELRYAMDCPSGGPEEVKAYHDALEFHHRKCHFARSTRGTLPKKLTFERTGNESDDEQDGYTRGWNDCIDHFRSATQERTDG